MRLKIAAGFIRGGNWNNGANDGAFTLNLNNAPSNSNTNIGFRCSRYALPAHAGGQNKSSTEPSQKSHRSILTHSFSRADIAPMRENIGPLLPLRVSNLAHGMNAQGGASGLLAYINA